MNNKITISLDEYIQLLTKAKSPLLDKELAILNLEQANNIRQTKDWNLIFHIEEISPNELEDFKILGLIREIQTLDSPKFFKLYRLDTWREVYAQEMERRATAAAYRVKVNQIIERKLEAANQLVRMNFASDLSTAREFLNQVILKGLIPGIAKLLNVEDLIEK